MQHAADRGLKVNGNNTYRVTLLNVLLLTMILELSVSISHVTHIINDATAHALPRAHTNARARSHAHRHSLEKFQRVFICICIYFVGLLALDSKTGRTSQHRLVFLIFRYVQANVELAAKIPSYHCMLLVQPSMFKFTKINPLALKLR